MNLKIFILLACFGLLYGCDHTYHPVLEKSVNTRSILVADSDATADWPAADWWKKYKNQDLNDLIEYAIANSPDIEVAKARFISAVVNIKQINPASKIDINLLANFNGDYTSKNGVMPPPFSGKWNRTFTTGLSLSYQLDIWGVNKGLLASATSLAKAQAANIENAKLLIVSTIVQNYFVLQLNFARLNLNYQLLDIQQQILTTYRNSLSLGLISVDDVIQIQNQLNQTQLQIATLKNNINIQKSILIALVGDEETLVNKLGTRNLPKITISVPHTLDYELLSRRADLQAQKWAVESNIGLVASAKAAFYPNFSLTGFAGFSSISLNNLLSLPSKQFNIIPSLYLPIFNTGMLTAQLRSRQAKHNEAITTYNAAIINAVKDVNIAVHNLNLINNHIEVAQNNLKLAKQLYNNGKSKMQLGIIPQVAVLNLSANVIAYKDIVTSLTYQRLINDVDLIKALGGGYQSISTKGEK